MLVASPIWWLLLGILAPRGARGDDLVPIHISGASFSSLSSATSHAYAARGDTLSLSWDGVDLGMEGPLVIGIFKGNVFQYSLLDPAANTGTITVKIPSTAGLCQGCRIGMRAGAHGGWSGVFDITASRLPGIVVNDASGPCGLSEVEMGKSYTVSWATWNVPSVSIKIVSYYVPTKAMTVKTWLTKSYVGHSYTFTMPETLLVAENFRYYLIVESATNRNVYDSCANPNTMWAAQKSTMCSSRPTVSNAVVVPSQSTSCGGNRRGRALLGPTRALMPSLLFVFPELYNAWANERGRRLDEARICPANSISTFECASGYKFDIANSLCANDEGANAEKSMCGYTCTNGDWHGRMVCRVPADATPSDATPSDANWLNTHTLFIVLATIGILVIGIVIGICVCNRTTTKTHAKTKTETAFHPGQKRLPPEFEMASVAIVAGKAQGDISTGSTGTTGPSAPPVSRPSSMDCSKAQITGASKDIEIGTAIAIPLQENPMTAPALPPREPATKPKSCCDNDCGFMTFFIFALLLLPVWIYWLCYWGPSRKGTAPRNVNTYTQLLNAFWILTMSISSAIAAYG